MKAADVMTSPIVAVRTDATLSQAVRLMVDNRISGLPVLDEAGHLAGILTEGDLLRRAETETAASRVGWFGVFFAPGRLAGEYVQTHSRRVQDVMTQEVVTVVEDTPVAEITEMMRNRRIKRLPVLRDDAVIGIVSRSDMLRVLLQKLDVPAPTASDAEIRDQVLKELAAQPWAPRRSLSIAVTDGVVEIDGVVFDVREHDAVRVLAENVPGVRSVENRVVCVEPNTGTLIIDPDEERASGGRTV